MKIRLLVVCEDDSRVRDLCDGIAQDAVNGIAMFQANLQKLHAQAALIQPDVLLFEHSELGDGAQEVLLPFAHRHPAARILFLCDCCPRELMLVLIRLGAYGCVYYGDSPAVVARAIRTVHRGGAWFGRSSLMLAVRSVVKEVPVIAPRVAEGRLTLREEEIFDLIGQGLTNKEIARQLDISDHTVKTHLHRVYVKLQQSGRYKALLSQPGRLAQ